MTASFFLGCIYVIMVYFLDYMGMKMDLDPKENTKAFASLVDRLSVIETKDDEIMARAIIFVVNKAITDVKFNSSLKREEVLKNVLRLKRMMDAYNSKKSGKTNEDIGEILNEIRQKIGI